jgi:hypothetical protein
MRPRLHSNGKALSIAINLLVGPYAPGRNVILLPDPAHHWRNGPFWARLEGF